MNLSINTGVFIVIIAHEIGFRAFAYPARRRTVSQLGIVSITCKPKSQLPHLVFIMTVNLQDQQTQLVLQSLRATAQEVARVEGITYAQALERVMSVMCND